MFPNPFRKVPDKKSAGKAGSKPKTGGKPAAGRGSGGSGASGARARPKGRGAGAQRPMQAPGLSLDRKLDIIGIVLVFIGLLTGLSLFSANNSDIPFLTAWLSLNRQIAGWGVFGLPLGFIAIGLWLVLRKFGDKLPKLEYERLVGLVLLYLALLTTFHFFAAETKAAVFETVATGRGGGLLGAAILWTILGALGTLGAAVLLVAWWIISIVLIAGLSVPELLMLGAGLVRRVRGQPVERQLPLPNMGETVTRSAVAAEPIIAPRPSQPTTARPAPAQKAAAPAAAQAARAAPPAAPTTEAVLFPPPASAPAPSYDQPLVIGGDQPWVLPEVADMLDAGTESSADDEYDRQRANMIENTLAAFGAPVKVVEVNRGPTITQFGVEPDFVEQRNGKKTKVKVGKIAALADDLALALSAHSIRIEAPVPGKGYVGIEVPNSETSLVALRDVMESENFDKLKGGAAPGLGPGRLGQPPSPPGSTACRTCSSPAPPAPARACASTPSSPACCCRTRPTT